MMRLSWCRKLLVLGVLGVQAVGCSDDKDGDDRGPNHPPTAAIITTGTAAAGAPLVFDASGSSDPDGDTLTYSWDFGNGQRGGGKKIAMVFDEAGSFTVKLTVWDRRDGSAEAQQTFTVTAGPVANGSVDSYVVVRDTLGAPLEGVTVTLVNGSASATTDSEGRATIATPRGVPATVRFTKAGYAGQVKRADLPGDIEGGYLEVTMRERDGTMSLGSARAGGSLTGRDGTKVTFLPNSLVDSVSGAAVTGAVEVAMTPVDVGNDVQAFPGQFAGVRTDGAQGPIRSYGVVEYGLDSNGAAVQLAPGMHATIEVPIYTALNTQGLPLRVGDTIPYWSLNERTGGWTEEGMGTVIAGEEMGSFKMLAEVTHFSWWNCDDFVEEPAEAKPKCLVDTNLDGVLEDLTGTGYCYHAGTGPEATPSGFGMSRPGVSSQALVAPQQPPAYAVTATTPVGGGRGLQIPSNTDVTFRSYAMNGTLFGTKVVNLPPGASQDIEMVLEEVQENPGTLPITVPYNDGYRINAKAEVDRYTFATEAGGAFSVRVRRSAYSTMDGRVRVLDANGQQRVSAEWGGLEFSTTIATDTGGTYTVEVIAVGNVPGTYVLELQPAVITGGCDDPTPLVMSTPVDLSIPSGDSVCYSVTLAADAAVAIADVDHSGFSGTVRLFAPSGEQVGVNSQNTENGGIPIELNAAVIQAGEYRLEIANTNTATAAINGFGIAPLTIAGTITAQDDVTYTASADAQAARWYIVKRDTPTSSLGLGFSGSNHRMMVYPNVMSAEGSPAAVRVVGPSSVTHALVRVSRYNVGTAWNFTLSAWPAAEVPIGTAVDLDVSGAGIIGVYALTAAPGDRLSVGWQASSTFNITTRVYRPQNGTELPAAIQGHVYEFTEGGTYTLMIQSTSSQTGTVQYRVSDVPAPEVVELPGGATRTITLGLGDARLFTIPATVGDVFALRLTSAEQVDVHAITQGNIAYDARVTLDTNAAPPRVAYNGPRYMRLAGTATVLVASPSHTVGQATGTFELVIESPSATGLALGTRVSPIIAPRTFARYDVTVPAEGKYNLCVEYPTSIYTYKSVVWGPSAPVTSYTGDLETLASGAGTGRDEVIKTLRAGANTLTLAATGTTAAQTGARLVQLLAPTPITVGGGNVSGAIAGACERSYYGFTAAPGQAFTVTLNAGFNGNLRVRKIPPNGDPTIDDDLSVTNVPGSPTTFSSGVTKTLSFTLPASSPHNAGGTYVLEVDAAGEASGAFTVSIASP